jgi:hypothetical protein
MTPLPTHRNSFTGEILANHVQVCTACHCNFESSKAADLHRAWDEEVRICRNPNLIGLLLTINSHGAIIYSVAKSPALKQLLEQLQTELENV